MADICVIYASENEDIARKLVKLLRNNWEVWWAGDITQGHWENEVRRQLSNSKAVVPIFSYHTQEKDYFVDELEFAKKNGLLMFPFFIDEIDPPFGFGKLNRTMAIGWNGDKKHKGYLELVQKIIFELAEINQNKTLTRGRTIHTRDKSLELPCFVFSLSTHDTQVRPEDGVKLFRYFEPSACLVSAYDAWNYYEKNEKDFFDDINALKQSKCTLFLDSGNYEAYRKDDRYSENNKTGWSSEKFRNIASIISPDVAFSFDESNPKGTLDEIAGRIIQNFYEDEKSISSDFPICPIIHLPRGHDGTLSEYASQLIAKVTSSLNPIMVAIPERELGDGLIERFKSVRDIRIALNALGKYYPLHLLGTGNPISMIAFAAAGADSFDGLEWCRTAADYSNGHLFHFSHFDCFFEQYSSRVSSPAIRAIVADSNASYIAKVASYNIDYFSDSAKTMKDMITAGQIEHLLKNVPNIGKLLFEELKK